MSFFNFHDDTGALRCVNMANVREVTFIHRNQNIREEIILRHTDNSETRLPKTQRRHVAAALGLSPEDFLTPAEKAERDALRAEAERNAKEKESV